MCVSIGQHAVQSTEGQFSHAVGTLFGADHIAIVPSIHRIHSIVLSSARRRRPPQGVRSLATALSIWRQNYDATQADAAHRHM